MADTKVSAMTNVTDPQPGDELYLSDGGVADSALALSVLGHLAQASHTTDAAITGLVGTLHVIEMNSGTPFTAVRQFTLPTTFAVGERCGLYIIDGDATHEVSVRTGASGDLIQDVDYSAADFTKLFIAGEMLVFEGIVANTAWALIHDGRIPCVAKLTTSVTQELVDDTLDQIELDQVASGDPNVGAIADTTNDQFEVRRDGSYLLLGSVGVTDAIATDSKNSIRFRTDAGAANWFLNYNHSAAASVLWNVSCSGLVAMSDGDVAELWAQIDFNSGSGVTTNDNTALTWAICREVL